MNSNKLLREHDKLLLFYDPRLAAFWWLRADLKAGSPVIRL